MHCLFFENVMILETILLEIIFSKNCKCSDILILSAIMVSNAIGVECFDFGKQTPNSQNLEFPNVVIEEISIGKL